MLAPTCFGNSLPSSGSFWIRLSYVKIQIDIVVYHIMWLSSLCVGSVVVQSVVLPSWVHTTDTSRLTWCFAFGYKPHKGLKTKTDRLIIRYRTTWTTVCVWWKDVKTKKEDWVRLRVNSCRHHLCNVTSQNEIKLYEHKKLRSFCCDAVSLSVSRLLESMYYFQLSDAINNIVVSNSNFTSQHAIITHSSNSYTVSNT
jgi:hypothetical protein